MTANGANGANGATGVSGATGTSARPPARPLDRMFVRPIDRLLALAHALACCAIAGLALMIVVQVAARTLDATLALLGLPVTGFIIPSLAEIAGFLFVAGTFLALGSTLREGVHIRVTLLIDHVPAPLSRALRTLAATLGAALFGFAAWHALELTADSVRFGEVSYGIVAIPLALPQAAMTAGLVVFALAMAAQAARDATDASPDTTGAPPDATDARPDDTGARPDAKENP